MPVPCFSKLASVELSILLISFIAGAVDRSRNVAEVAQKPQQATEPHKTKEVGEILRVKLKAGKSGGFPLTGCCMNCFTSFNYAGTAINMCLKIQKPASPL
jgi:hypothetical protein